MMFKGHESTTHEINNDNQSTEWLNLRLSGTMPSTADEPDSQSKPAPVKLFSCNFCQRKFFSSQTLGSECSQKGKRSSYRRIMTMMGGLPTNNSMFRSLGVRTHSLDQKSSRDGTAIAETFNIDAYSGLDMSWRSTMVDDTMNMVWLGSFLFEPQRRETASGTYKLDLNLRL